MNLYEIWFSRVKLPDEIKNQFLDTLNTPEEIWEYVKNEGCIKNKTISKAFNSAMNTEEINKIIDVMGVKGINYVTVMDERYPKKLISLPDHPFLIYYYGDIEKVNDLKAVSIVGSRRCTVYGRDSAYEISSGLSKHSVNIVSGMARGIDSISHWGTLNNEGFTTAVLGCGLDTVYPRENKRLYEEIKLKGCIMSEFPPGTPPFPYNFPLRNRLISGLSDLLIVVEAARKSGSLITAGRAADQGRDVMAVPGSIFSKNSLGTNELIKDGAEIFVDMEHLLDKLNIISLAKNDNLKKVYNDIKMDTIYNILTDTPTHIDDIIRITNIDISILYELLLEMQLENTIRCIAGNYYVKINGSL
ncbi:MAG: DNA-processing protein DprA [Bacillota bacterium]|nr:DNA-processing protein DprA [Bacillota bacterium]